MQTDTVAFQVGYETLEQSNMCISMKVIVWMELSQQNSVTRETNSITPTVVIASYPSRKTDELLTNSCMFMLMFNTTDSIGQSVELCCGSNIQNYTVNEKWKKNILTFLWSYLKEK